MIAAPERFSADDGDAAAALRNQIARCAGRRVTDVEVVVEANRVVVRGRAFSYHAWQLALAAFQQWLHHHDRCGRDCAFLVPVEYVANH